MAMAIGGMSAYNNISTVRPMNYALSNESQVSQAYSTEATKDTAGVNAVNPVRYANAQTHHIGQTSRLADVQKATKQYNEVAANFSGVTTGYNSSQAASSYEMIGSTIDLYA